MKICEYHIDDVRATNMWDFRILWSLI